jgi:hypothetical protein
VVTLIDAQILQSRRGLLLSLFDSVTVETLLLLNKVKMLKYIVGVLCLLVAVQAQNTFPQELNSIDFESILGGPLNAVVEAQAQAARTTAEFINDLGFTTKNGEKHVIMVSFVYEKFVNNTFSNFSMTLPFLTLVPIPYIEIHEFVLNFKYDS